MKGGSGLEESRVVDVVDEVEVEGERRESKQKEIKSNKVPIDAFSLEVTVAV